ncbi:MAG TPA: aldehyde dehydrogenase family protein [Caulobacteraceae bacterium]
MAIPFGGDRLTRVSEALAAAFRPGDRLIVVQETGDLLHVPAAVHAIATAAVDRAVGAFSQMGAISDAAISAFFDDFARRLGADDGWSPISAANAADVAAAKARGRSTTRLAASVKMRAGMIAGLREWRDAAPSRGRQVERIDHEGWSVEQVTAPLGVVGFVFEGRPNVFADAAGVLRGGNTVVFRIGSDALGTAKAIVEHALAPALAAAGLPTGACVLVESAEHAAGWALFSDPRLGLAVARGSGRAVAQLGAVARQAGVPVSLHGTGGAWLVADESADADRFEAAVVASLDRKACNTLNVCCIVRSRAEALIPRFLTALQAAGDQRGHGCKLHVGAEDAALIPESWRSARTLVRRAEGDVDELLTDLLPPDGLSREWEWEETPEVALKVVEDVGEAVKIFNRLSPRFSASLISDDAAAHERFFAGIEAGFVGDGMTRWVDGQYAFNRPELGLSNWEHGRLLARSGVLSGDSVFTIRTRMRQKDPGLHR